MARHGRRLLNLLDDTPVVPGDVRPQFEHGAQARQVLNDAEEDLRDWRLEVDDVHIASHLLDSNLMPTGVSVAGTSYTEEETEQAGGQGEASEKRGPSGGTQTSAGDGPTYTAASQQVTAAA